MVKQHSRVSCAESVARSVGPQGPDPHGLAKLCFCETASQVQKRFCGRGGSKIATVVLTSSTRTAMSGVHSAACIIDGVVW